MFRADGSRVRTAKRPALPLQNEAPPMERHFFEDFLNRPWVRRFLGRITVLSNGSAPMERIFNSYRNPEAPMADRLRYAPIHMLIDLLIARTRIPRARALEKVFRHQPTVRTLVNTARSIAKYGLVAPQRFVAPLLVVWNITNACNLLCRHCYQDSSKKKSPDELTRAEKLDLVDQLSEICVPMLALAGGEPLCDPDIWAVLERARRKKVYVTIATNGTLLTKKNVERIAALGVKYIEVSLDSMDPEIHDSFRGIPGAWRRTVEGIRNVVATAGVRCGIATCFTRQTVHRAPEMIRFAVDLGVHTFVHFNFIPVGRGVEMGHEEMTVEQREWLLQLLKDTLNEGKIGIMSTAPQFGRACIMFNDPDAAVAMGHAGSGKGRQAKVVSKYIGGCGALRCYCCVEPNGRVTPCVYMPGIELGDLRQKRFAQIWNHPLESVFCDRDDLGDHCGACHYRAYCGGCRARAFAYTGDAQAGDPGCVYNRHMWDEILSRGENDREVQHGIAGM